MAQERSRLMQSESVFVSDSASSIAIVQLDELLAHLLADGA